MQQKDLSGSSPRAWVLAGPVRDRSDQGRFIPTCVGLGTAAPGIASVMPVHPHVRGSWRGGRSRRAAFRGSSPRAWVLALEEQDAPNYIRFIPTCVGLGRANRAPGRGDPVHPHVRGSWDLGDRLDRRPPGSSPRAWVLVVRRGLRRARRRFIPTCVGLGSARATPKPRKSVHPHVRGSWPAAQPRTVAHFGSSPRAWVLGELVRDRVPDLRFIPTCVGLGEHAQHPVRRRAVHPHVRGSWYTITWDGAHWHGSSPRAWVLASGPVAAETRVRFIPTCVGLGASARVAGR